MHHEMQYHFYNSHTLLLINNTGKIKVLYTPFKVLSCTEHDGLPNNTWFYVDEVLQGINDQLIYSINGQLYNHNGFTIHINF